MHRRSRLLAPLVTLSAIAACAERSDDLLACLDSDVRAGLLGSMYEPERQVTRSMSSRLRDLTLPTGFILVGTSESDVASNTAFRVTLDPAEALAVVDAAVRDLGWEAYGAGGTTSPTGFVAGPTPERAAYCRDNDMLTVIAGRREASTYVTLLSTVPVTAGAGSICDSRRGSSRLPALVAGFGIGLSAHLPRLALPADARRSGQPPFPAVGRAGVTQGVSRAESATAKMTVETALDLASLEQFFAEQLRSQDWDLDAQWTGRSSAGSSWTASRLDGAASRDIRLTGVLTVMTLADGSYDAAFHMTRVD